MDTTWSVYGEISRTRFETLLVRRLDKVRVGTAQRAKLRIGGAWRRIIDDMYAGNADRLSSNKFAPVLTECADVIVQLMKSVNSKDLRY